MRWPAEGDDRAVAAQDFAEHHLAGGGSCRQRAQERTIEAAQLRAQDVVAEGNLGLFDRIGEHDVEARHLGAAVEHRREDAADLWVQVGVGECHRTAACRRSPRRWRSRRPALRRDRPSLPSPNTSQRSAVRMSIDQPWTKRSAASADANPQARATSRMTMASRPGRASCGPPINGCYCSVTRRPITGPAPATASASTTKATDLRIQLHRIGAAGFQRDVGSWRNRRTCRAPAARRLGSTS